MLHLRVNRVGAFGARHGEGTGKHCVDQIVLPATSSLIPLKVLQNAHVHPLQLISRTDTLGSQVFDESEHGLADVAKATIRSRQTTEEENDPCYKEYSIINIQMMKYCFRVIYAPSHQ
jgi:hypothetical protein